VWVNDGVFVDEKAHFGATATTRKGGRQTPEYRMSRLSDDQIEAIARNLRKRLGIDNQTQPDMMTVIVKLKRLGLIKNYERVPDAQMTDDDAEYDPTSKVIRIAERTFVGMNNGDARCRFTIAHEIGHPTFGHTKLRYRNVSGREIEKIAPSIRKDESEANRFAAAFLAPLHLVPDDPHRMSVDEIASFFNLTKKAARIRKSELERLYRREHKIERPLPQVLVDFLNENRKR
jgi:Zn-dependent peptidase ImmA (M78 family)